MPRRARRLGKDYRKKYAQLLCDSEAQHPLSHGTWRNGKTRLRLRILHYRGKRRNPDQKGTYKELFVVTLENKDGDWAVTKYDAMY